ncbi:hypothetical protein [Gimesia maris]|jgi:hypothetical protein|uniref:Uncharacterized protein n=1 Tax=Gimesia maris TaxID=122 RepID=A0A3D3R578_9PLAN|nr:hypothetical protein [Gimesia maris]MAC56462.1 hypothetical protein [Gimesia sp.]HAW32448.1 hypothetical protein [Planctomycetaceae bacterium]EDL60487.1 hypothetical protein PM8797T_25856 [Gimesia maris DSM 8797]QDT80068.1 hypothetical protein Mal35_35370 [Gimesia maris]QDU15730.1 hypothetical protein CA11_35560 [Gimesia maris]|tara:strand:- start:115245 stop:115544 length:300 start_codon:yes stop_codon:yes gene_type:complete
MSFSVDNIQSLNELRQFIHKTLCEKENLLEEQFSMTEMSLIRRGRSCGLQFSINGPRSVRLGAIWASDSNMVYFYDARGERYAKVHLPNRIFMAEEEAA